jgi:hypothetical protein
VQSRVNLYIDEQLELEPWILECLYESLYEKVSITSRSNSYLLGINIIDQGNSYFNSDQLNLKFTGVNLNLFSDNDDSFFKFKTKEELLKLVPSIKEYIDKKISSLQQKLVVISNLNYKRLDVFNFEGGCEQLYLELVSCSSISELQGILEKNHTDYTFKEIHKLLDSDFSANLYLPEDQNTLCLLSQSDDINLDLVILKAINDFLSKINIVNRHRSTKDLNHIFTHLPYPIAILNIKHNSYSFNTEFSNLGINTKELSSYSDGQNIEVTNIGKMKVIITKLSEEFESISFIKIEQLEVNFSDQSQEELGIVSSSIAHELNNPLGGILAALDVLLLDDNPVEIDEKFTQMKSGVQRCKELVETFLSFSRKKQVDIHTNLSVNQILDQVIQLSRFRLIESNNQIKLNFNQVRINKYIKNSHLMTMCLYLIVGDLLTVSSRDNLLKQTVLSESLSLKVVEDIDKIEIELDQSFMFSSDFLTSKLFNYITDILKLKVLERGTKKVLSFY